VLRRQGGTINEDLLRHVAPARLGTHQADRRLRLEHCRSTAGRYAQTPAAAAISTGGLNSLNVPFRVEASRIALSIPVI
jgi:hypothetical protein